MIDTVFISDLHLHAGDPQSKKYFDAFVDWARDSVKTIYILGDFFYAWVGDDSLDEWSLGVAAQLKSLSDSGISVFYMAGNRDFLLGSRFAKLSGWRVIKEPFCLQLGQEKFVLMHGDSLCTLDLAHQRFRRLTRNWLFPLLFLRLPLGYRRDLVDRIRQKSMAAQKSASEMDVSEEAVLEVMRQNHCQHLIHGHTHRCGLSTYEAGTETYFRYVLSDWDDIPQVLCYDYTKGLCFVRMNELGD